MEEQRSKINKDHNTTCKLCGEEKEDIVHFTIKCHKLEKVRDNTLINNQLVNPIEKIKDLLFRNRRHLEVSIMIRNLWILRKKLLNEIKQKEENKNQNKKPFPQGKNLHQTHTSRDIQAIKLTKTPQQSRNTPGKRNSPQDDISQYDRTNLPQRKLAQNNQNPPG